MEFINENTYPVRLPGPSGTIIVIQPHQRASLSPWFKKYSPSFIKEIQSNTTVRIIQNQPQYARQQAQRAQFRQPIKPVYKPPQLPKPLQPARKYVTNQSPKIRGKLLYASTATASKYFKEVSVSTKVSISNNIGVGILSFNRLNSVRRLIESIRKYTDLSRTTIFISDESTKPEVKEYLKTIEDVVFINSETRLGVAGNSNRLLRALSRFKYKLLLNDDVEILKNGWEEFYFKQSLFHHFCMRQPGVCGAVKNEGYATVVGDQKIYTITSKPHGAVLAFDNLVFDTIGYFDEQYISGYEHVDWSNRVSISGIQPSGYHDIEGSTDYFTIHKEPSSIENEQEYLKKNAPLLNEHKQNKSRIYVKPSSASEIPLISYIIPCRGSDRENVINVVINNVRAQKFPNIEIIVVEQDNSQNISLQQPVIWKLVQGGINFNKAKAFNTGVCLVKNKKLILHDADMLVFDRYTSLMDSLLDSHTGAHVGNKVIYFSQQSTSKICKSFHVDPSLEAERVVDYFEGGSIGCTVDAYKEIGGFCERYEGWGCEDCDFFHRLKSLATFYNVRSIDLFHMWHSRPAGWKDRGNINRNIENEILKIPAGDRIIKQREYLKSTYPQLFS